MPKFPTVKRGRPVTDKRKHISIAATIDYRGADDSQLFFLFRNSPQSLVEEVFRFLIGKGNGIAKKAVVSEEHDVVRRNGKGYWRIAVELFNPNTYFCSIADMKILIESVFRRLYPCTFCWMSIDKFLNV